MVQDFPLSIFRPGRFSFSPSPLISYPASAGFIGNEFSFGRTHEWKKKTQGLDAYDKHDNARKFGRGRVLG